MSDFGDLLTIHSANEPMGTHRATLQASDIGFPHTYVGTRLGELQPRRIGTIQKETWRIKMAKSQTSMS